MKWEELSTPQFVEAVERCQGVCLLPLGVLEKHGDHLPLGTDVFIAREVACRAAELEPAVVFPSYFFTQIFEARHTPGTVGVNSRVMYDLLEATCAEIGRNGLKKIILVNGHGGNRHFLPHFMMLQLEQPRDYVIYLPSLWKMDDSSAQAWEERRQSPIEAEHAGEAETSLMLAIDPNLVRQEVLPPRQGHPLNRLQHLEEANLYTAIGWYASYPHHYAGEGEYGTAEKGEFLLNYMVNRLVEVMRVVKHDAITPALQAEFFESILK